MKPVLGNILYKISENGHSVTVESMRRFYIQKVLYVQKVLCSEIFVQKVLCLESTGDYLNG